MTSGADRIELLIKQRIERRRYVNRNKISRGGLHFTPLQLPGVAESLGRDYRRQTWSLAELLSYYDRQFVQNAYLVLLKRDADVAGLNDRLQRLQTGQLSRLELVFRLRYGQEGRAYKTRVRGLLSAFLLEKICRVPVLGVIPSYLKALLRLPRMQRDMEEIRGLIAMQKNDIEDKLRVINDFQNRELGKIVASLQE